MVDQQLQMIWFKELLKKKRVMPWLDSDIKPMLDVVMLVLVKFFI